MLLGLKLEKSREKRNYHQINSIFKMFGVFLKAKLDIETKISNLQKIYIDLLRIPTHGIIFNENNNSETALVIIQEQISSLEHIKKEYETALIQYKELTAELAEATEISESFESQIDQLFNLLELEIPEDLTRIESKKDQQTTLHEQTDEEDKENSQISQLSQEEEEDIVSDKENNQNRDPSFDSGGYFSPNIQIRKSTFTDSSNADCYTPAVKSHSKLQRQF